MKHRAMTGGARLRVEVRVQLAEVQNIVKEALHEPQPLIAAAREAPTAGGGVLHVDSPAGGGTRVKAELPVGLA